MQVLDKFVAIGCDGTNVNTGRKGGIIALMEQELQKPLQWLICQLHANELPLRHLLIHLDGATSGPHAFKGKIGKAMSVCETLPIVDFTPIESNQKQTVLQRWCPPFVSNYLQITISFQENKISY